MRRLLLMLGLAALSVVVVSTAASTLVEAREPSAAPGGARFTVAWAHTQAEIEAGVPLRYESFGNLADAVSAATGGTVRLGPEIRARDLTDEMLRRARAGGLTALASDTLISIDSDREFFTGSALLWSVPNSVGCTTGLSYSASFMPGGWNDRVSSAQSFAGCNQNPHYQNIFFGGFSYPCPCGSMGFMNNQTSSERWSP